jgi:hypothetical protein
VEALAVYDHVRTKLADEFGIDPGEMLQSAQEIFDRVTELLGSWRVACQNSNILTGFNELGDHLAADGAGSPDDQDQW